MIFHGNAILIEGEHVNADTVMGWYLGMDALPKEEIGAKFLSGVSPDLAERVKPDDILVCGRDFGYGKAHTSFFTAMQVKGVKCLVAESFSTQLVQTGGALGAVLVEVPGILEKVKNGDEIEVDAVKAVVKNITTGETIVGRPFPTFLQQVIEDGGQIKHLGKVIYMRKMQGK